VGKLDEAKMEIIHMTEKVQKLEKLNAELETENNDLTAKAGETKKGLIILRSENAKLSADLKELQSKPTTKGDSTAVSTLTEELEATKKELAQSKVSIDEWTALAKVSSARCMGLLYGPVNHFAVPIFPYMKTTRTDRSALLPRV
jgi:predicted RNase H-like nuclease (RuvC/YqgF family)